MFKTLKFALPLIIVVIGIIAAFYRVPSLEVQLQAKGPDEGTIIPDTNGKARQYRNGVIKVEPENFAVTGPAKELPDADKDPNRRTQHVEETIEQRRINIINLERKDKGLPPLTAAQIEKIEINMRNAEKIKKPVPGAGLAEKDFKDPALFSVDPTDSFAPQAMPTPNLTFQGASASDNAAAGDSSGFTPPDVNGDVGLNHYVSSINVSFKVYNKNGTVAMNAKLTNALFQSLPSNDPCRTLNDGDPVVVYDSLADRWVITQFAVPGATNTSANNYECMAVSTTNDPTGTWYVWSYLYPGTLFNDYPKLGVWTDAYHMTFNQFTNPGAWNGLGFLSMDRAKALAGDPTASVVYKNLYTLDPNAGGALPADVDGIVPPPAGLSAVMAEFRTTLYGDPVDGIRMYKWAPNFTNPAASVFAVIPDVALTAFDARSPNVSTGGTIEVLGGATLDGIADRLMHRFTYRNLGTYSSPTNSYTGSFSVNVSGVNPTTIGTYQTGIRWFEFRRTADQAFTVRDQGTHSSGAIDGANGLNNWMPSIAQDNAGNIAIGFSQAGTGQNADIKIAGRTGTSTGVGLNEGESLFWDALGAQTGTDNARWGDYSAMNVDPSDDCTFWYTQEYYATNSSTGFATRVGSFKYPGCSSVQKGTISGTITSCSTALPISGASVTATGGYHRLTPSNGTYSMTVVPGTYTVGASALGLAGQNQSATVTNGGTSTVNICVQGVAVIATGTPSITSESCGLPNSAPDPGETLSVSLPISNTGTANANNLTATLRASGGVASAVSQTYGAIAAGSSVTRTFTFQVSASTTCGSNVTLTWDIADGSTSYGAVTQTYGTGTPIVSLSQNFDSVTAPALPSGWVQNRTSGTGISWTTVTSSPVGSSPNAAFANGPETVNAAALESPAFNVTSTAASLTFKKAYNLESGTSTGFDGTVLEIKIGAGNWQDILVAGGSFVSGGYNFTLSSSYQSPLAGRQAWSGSSTSLSTTTVTLPASANGQSVKVRWLLATDNSTAPVGSGFRVDDVQISAGVQCASCTGSSKGVLGDFDGDRKTDVGVFRQSGGSGGAEWWYLKSGTSGAIGAFGFGQSTDKPVPGDYTGDGKTDLAFFRPSNGQWYVLRSNDFTFYAFPFGAGTDTPAPADYDGDGKTDAAVYRPSTGYWFILRSSNGAVDSIPFGTSTDKPVPSDFDGDGNADVAVWRSNGTNGAEWWYLGSTSGARGFGFGLSTDKAVPGDFTGDGKTDLAFFRPSNGQWYVLRSNDFTFYAFPFGASTDTPSPGDFDGDGKTDAAVYRSGQWFILRSGNSAVDSVPFGAATDKPVPSVLLP